MCGTPCGPFPAFHTHPNQEIRAEMELGFLTEGCTAILRIQLPETEIQSVV